MQRFETAVQTRLATAKVGVVHDVVMHESSRVEDLERRGDRDHGIEGLTLGLADVVMSPGVVAETGNGAPSPVTEQGAESLAAGKQLARGLIDDLEVGRDRRQGGPLLGEEPIESGLDEID